MDFNTWIDTFVDEKGINIEETFDVEGESGLNIVPVGVVIEHMKITSPQEQQKIKDMIVKIDFHNGDVLDFFKHLAKAIAR